MYTSKYKVIIFKGKIMNYKEIKKHNRAERKKYNDTWLSDNPHEPKYIDLIEHVFDHATTDEGMTIQHRVIFHLFNPNGACNKLPTYDDFIFIEEPNMICGSHGYLSKYDNYGYKKLLKHHQKGNASKWDVNYALYSIDRDIKNAKEIMIEKNLVGKDTFAAEGVK